MHRPLEHLFRSILAPLRRFPEISSRETMCGRRMYCLAFVVIEIPGSRQSIIRVGADLGEFCAAVLRRLATAKQKDSENQGRHGDGPISHRFLLRQDLCFIIPEAITSAKKNSPPDLQPHRLQGPLSRRAARPFLFQTNITYSRAIDRWRGSKGPFGWGGDYALGIIGIRLRTPIGMPLLELRDPRSRG